MFKVTYTDRFGTPMELVLSVRKQTPSALELAVEQDQVDPKFYRRSKDGHRWILEKNTENLHYSGLADLFTSI